MSQARSETPIASLSIQDILFVLFKHKGKILLCAAIGLVAAATVYLLSPPLYESQAKLLVRYVVDRSAVDPEAAGNSAKIADAINSEVQIITSWDLALQVAEAIGVQRLLPDADHPVTKAEAAYSIRLAVEATPAGKASNVIMVSYKNHDPKLATLILDELIGRYFVKHLEVHRSAEAFNFVTQQSDQVRARLNQTEDALKQLKGEARITSLTETTTNLSTELAKTREALKTAETERAQQLAVVQEMEKSFAGQNKKSQDAGLKSQDAASVANTEAVQQYHTIVARLANLRQTDLELVSRYAQKTESPESLDEQYRARQIRPERGQLSPAAQAARASARARAFVGADRDRAQSLARERYHRQNDSGFSYRGTKKSFDTLVKEAEQEIVKEKLDKSLRYQSIG